MSDADDAMARDEETGMLAPNLFRRKQSRPIQPPEVARLPAGVRATLGLQLLIPYHGLLRRNRAEHLLAKDLDMALRAVLARVVITAPVTERSI